MLPVIIKDLNTTSAADEAGTAIKATENTKNIF